MLTISHIPSVLLNPFMHAPSCFANVYFAALYTTPSCFRRSTGSLGRTKCDLSVVSDLKTDRTPCCCRQRRSGSDRPLMYGSTAVGFISVAGSLSDVCQHQQGQWNWDSWSVDAYNQPPTWQPISTAADPLGISFFLSQCQQCFVSKPTNHERGLWYTNH